MKMQLALHLDDNLLQKVHKHIPPPHPTNKYTHTETHTHTYKADTAK